MKSYPGDREALLASARYPRIEFTMTEQEQKFADAEMDMMVEVGWIPQKAPMASLFASKREQFNVQGSGFKVRTRFRTVVLIYPFVARFKNVRFWRKLGTAGESVEDCRRPWVYPNARRLRHCYDPYWSTPIAYVRPHS